MQNRYEILLNNNPDNDIQTKYDNLLRSIKYATANLVGKSTRKNRKNWVPIDTIHILKQRNKAKVVFKQNPNAQKEKSLAETQRTAR